jgi:hypothetical protein
MLARQWIGRIDGVFLTPILLNGLQLLIKGIMSTFPIYIADFATARCQKTENSAELSLSLRLTPLYGQMPLIDTSPD